MELKIEKITQALTDEKENLKQKKIELNLAKGEVKIKTSEFKTLESQQQTAQNTFDKDNKDNKKPADDKVNDLKEKLNNKIKERLLLLLPGEIGLNEAEQTKLKSDIVSAEANLVLINLKNTDLKTKLDDINVKLAATKIAKDAAEAKQTVLQGQTNKAQDETDKAQDAFDKLPKGVAIIDPSLLKTAKDPSFSDIKGKLIKNLTETINDINKINNQTVKVSSLYVLENKAHSNSDIEAFISAATRNTIKTPIKNGNIYYLPESSYNDLIKIMPNFQPTLKYIKPDDNTKYLKNITYQDVLSAYTGNAQDITDPNKLTT